MKLRYFIDWGGDFLWADDDESHEKYGYPVDTDLLPLSEQTKQMAIQLFDAWSKPSDEPSSEKNANEFTELSDMLYASIVQELGSSFEVLNEM